jgi:hypothetical protein
VGTKWNLLVKQRIEDPLGSFRTLQVVIAAVCMLIPLTLKLLDHDEFYPKKLTSAGLTVPLHRMTGFVIDSTTCIADSFHGLQLSLPDTMLHIQTGTAARVLRVWGYRTSISDYVDGSRSYVFGILYTMASLLFLFNGAVYLRSRKDLQLLASGHWFNIYIGLSLLGVAFCPSREHPALHTIFSVLFFVGNLIVLIFIANPGETRTSKTIRIAMAVAVLLSLVAWRTHHIQLLWAEWISLIVFAIHLILVTIAVENKPDKT